MDEIIINNVLCFIQSAKSDHSKESLFDIAYSFYSVEEIKNAKEILFDKVSKDVVARKEPNKKQKELNDLIEAFTDIQDNREFKKLKFVTDSYKKMPPIGLEFIAPLIVNLSEEIAKINEILPKIADIKTEVINTADTVRDMKMDITNLKWKLNNNVKHDKPTNSPVVIRNIDCVVDIASESNVDCNVADESLKTPSRQTYSSKCRSNSSGREIYNNHNILSPMHGNNNSAIGRIENNDDKSKDEDNGWIKVGQRKLKNNNVEGVARGSFHTSGKNTMNNVRYVTGVKKSSSTGSSFYAARRTVDVFIGRVDSSVDGNDIVKYIKDNFKVDVNSINKLSIQTDAYNAFKVNVNFMDRDKLFMSDMWPENILVKKYYNRKGNPKNNSNSNS